MAKVYTLHPKNPQKNRIEDIVLKLRRGGVILYPTDTNYALGCDINHKNSIEKLRFIRLLPPHYPLSILVPSFTGLSQFAKIPDNAYRIMKALVPGPYTFILPATKEVPKLLQDPKRKTIGIRIPSNPICLELLRELGNPLVSISAKLDEEELAYPSSFALFEQYGPIVDFIIDDENEDPGSESTIIDFTDEEPVIRREGLGMDRVLAVL